MIKIMELLHDQNWRIFVAVRYPKLFLLPPTNASDVVWFLCVVKMKVWWKDVECRNGESFNKNLESRWFDKCVLLPPTQTLDW